MWLEVFRKSNWKYAGRCKEIPYQQVTWDWSWRVSFEQLVGEWKFLNHFLGKKGGDHLEIQRMPPTTWAMASKNGLRMDDMKLYYFPETSWVL